jgi:hypothetical protein
VGMRLGGVWGAGLVAMLLTMTAQAEGVRMARATPYAEDAEVARKIRQECVKLTDQLPAYTREFGAAFGVDIDLVDEVSSEDAGPVLVLEIDEAVSQGNAFIGHRKYSQVSGTLYRDGDRVAGFKAMRGSMGGAFAGYKGSCSVLGRTMKALGKDIAQWLKQPDDEAELGDM